MQPLTSINVYGSRKSANIHTHTFDAYLNAKRFPNTNNNIEALSLVWCEHRVLCVAIQWPMVYTASYGTTWADAALYIYAAVYMCAHIGRDAHATASLSIYIQNITTKAFKSHLWRHDFAKRMVIHIPTTRRNPTGSTNIAPICDLCSLSNVAEGMRLFCRLIGESNSASHELHCNREPNVFYFYFYYSFISFTEAFVRCLSTHRHPGAGFNCALLPSHSLSISISLAHSLVGCCSPSIERAPIRPEHMLQPI